MNTLRSLVAPISVNYELTQVCNLRCSFCFSNSATHTHRQPTMDHVVKIVDALVTAKVFELRWFGGEFTSFRRWHEVLDYAQDQGLFMAYVSNGTLIKEEDAQFLINHGIDGGAMSLHGPERIHDEVVGVAGSFEKTIRAIRLCHDHGVSTTVLFTPTKNNFPHLVELARWLHDNNAPITELDVGRLCPSGEAIETWAEHHLSLDDYYRLFAMMKDIREETGLNIYMGDAFPLCLLPLSDWHLVTGCWQGTGFGHIGANGDVKSCSILKGTYGNLLEKPLQEIWTSALNEMRTLEYLPRQCRHCPHFCGGGCSATRPGVSHYAPDQFIPTPDEENLSTLARRLPGLLMYWWHNLSNRPARAEPAPVPEWSHRPKIACRYRIRQEADGHLGYFRHLGVLTLDNFSAQAIQLMDGTRTIDEIERHITQTTGKPRWQTHTMLQQLFANINRKGFLEF